MSKKRTNFNLQFKQDEHELIFEWFNKQTNITDSIRYMIEMDIVEQGEPSNLQERIPAYRDLDKLLGDSKEPTKTPEDILAQLDQPIKSVVRDNEVKKSVRKPVMLLEDDDYIEPDNTVKSELDDIESMLDAWD